MTKGFRYISIILLLATLSSCCGCRSYQKKTQRPFQDTQWSLVQLMGREITISPNSMKITFLAENRMVGNGGCNNIQAKYVLSENRAIEIGQIASTMMMCPNMELEQEFMSVLQSTTHYEMDGPNLLLLFNGELRAVLEAK